MKTSIGYAAFACLLCFSNCGEPELSPVSPLLAAESTMRAFARMIGGLTAEQRERLVSVEQLYALNHGDENFESFRSATWSHAEWEAAGRPRFDYQIYPNTMAISDDDAILIATPREIMISNGVFSRVALTYSLETIRIEDDEFHRRILRQAGSLERKID